MWRDDRKEVSSIWISDAEADAEAEEGCEVCGWDAPLGWDSEGEVRPA